MVNEDLMECHYSFERLAKVGELDRLPENTMKIFLGRLARARKSPIGGLDKHDQAWLDAALSFWRDYFKRRQQRKV